MKIAIKFSGELIFNVPDGVKEKFETALGTGSRPDPKGALQEEIKNGFKEWLKESIKDVHYGFAKNIKVDVEAKLLEDKTE